MGKPRCTPKKAVHLTPQKAKIEEKAPITPLPECKGKGFMDEKANALIKEVLDNRKTYKTDQDAAVRLGVSHVTIYRWRLKLLKGEDPVTPSPSKSPPVNRSNIDDDIKKILAEDDELSAVEIRDKLKHDYGKEVSDQTVRNRMKAMNLVFKEFRRVPAKYDPAKRLAFAKKEFDRWKKAGKNTFYVFMDEFWCNATHRRKGKYVSKDEPQPVIKANERFVPKVNTFAMLCEGRLFCWDMPEGSGEKGGITKDDFLAQFKKTVGPQMANLKKWADGREIRFMLDGAAIHGKKELAEWAAKVGVTFIEEWPPHSPDLNPIENIFARIKDAVGKELQIYTMQNADESRKKISAKRDKVAKAMAGKCRGYVESFPDRLKKCIDNGGEHTGY